MSTLSIATLLLLIKGRCFDPQTPSSGYAPGLRLSFELNYVVEILLTAPHDFSCSSTDRHLCFWQNIPKRSWPSTFAAIERAVVIEHYKQAVISRTD